jgi:hypothetical protein
MDSGEAVADRVIVAVILSWSASVGHAVRRSLEWAGSLRLPGTGAYEQRVATDAIRSPVGNLSSLR